MMKLPKVLIIISNWNGLEDTVECLESLRSVTYTHYEIAVVDNGSTGGDALALKERFGEYIHIILNDKNYGYAAGANAGIKYGLNNREIDYFMVLNNDTIVDPRFLNELVEAAEGDALIGAVGPKVYHYSSTNLIQTIGGRLNLNNGKLYEHIAEVDCGQYNSPREVDWHGPCLMVKAEVIRKVGLYDEGYFVFWEDVDFCFRIKKAGYKILYIPESKIWHKGGRSTGRLNNLYYPIRNRFRFMKKYATRIQYLKFLTYFFGYDLWYRFFSLASRYKWNYRHLIAAYNGIKDGALNDGDIEKR